MSSIKYFREFLTLSEFLNFSAAAESLYITQPVLSKHISALESTLDVRLFERTTQSVKLTPEGKLFKERIRKLVDDYEDLCSNLRMLKAGYSNRLRIGCPYYAMRDYLGDIPELFGGRYDEIKLMYSVGDPHEIMKMLIEKKVDLAIAPKYPLPQTEHLRSYDIYKERLGILINSEEPLANEKVVSLKDLKNMTFFSVGNVYFNAAWHHTVSLCQEAGFTPNDPELFNQMEALIMGIRHGGGITVIGRHLRNQASEQIKYLPLGDAAACRTISIWYDPDNKNEAIGKFIRFYSEMTGKKEVS